MSNVRRCTIAGIDPIQEVKRSKQNGSCPNGNSFTNLLLHYGVLLSNSCFSECHPFASGLYGPFGTNQIKGSLLFPRSENLRLGTLSD